jgi:hypothetical protein
MTNINIQTWLNQMLPIPQLVQITGQVLIYFIMASSIIVVAGCWMTMSQTDEIKGTVFRTGVIVACIASSPWFLTLTEQIANTLVGAIATADPALNWLIVNNPPGNSALAMDYSKPFAVIGQYVGGTFANTGGMQWWEVGKEFDYLSRGAVIGFCGFVACWTVLIMQLLLILQKLILVVSGPLMPVFVASLLLPATHGSGVNFLKQLVGVACWPIGWAIVHIGTMAFLQTLHPPAWTAGLGELILAGIGLSFICLYMVLGTIAAPGLIVLTVIGGSNFANHLMAGVASAAGQHASRGLKSGGAVTGALIGSAAGPGGAATGAAIGAQVGGMAAAPVTAATEAADGVNGGRRAVPSSRSAGFADAAIAEIKRRSA